MKLQHAHLRPKKPRTFYELLGDVRVASPRLCDLGRTIGDLGRTTGRLRGFSARFPRTGHELDSHSKKIRCSRAAPTLPRSLAPSLTCSLPARSLHAHTHARVAPRALRATRPAGLEPQTTRPKAAHSPPQALQALLSSQISTLYSMKMNPARLAPQLTTHHCPSDTTLQPRYLRPPTALA